VTFIFFGSVLLLSLGREVTFYFIQKSANMSPPYLILGNPFKILRLPMVLYIGWATTFYLSWYLAQRILKRIGGFSERIFPTILWAILVTGGISYCVEASAIRAGWWAWMFHDPRFKDFLLVPFSALEGWTGEIAFFLLIFFIVECSKYRRQWWRVFLYGTTMCLIINTITYLIVSLSSSDFDIIPNINIFIRALDSVRISLPIILMFFWSISFKYERLDTKNSKIGLFFYDAIPLFALLLILLVCIGIDIVVLNNSSLLFSVFPLIFLLLVSIKKVPVALIFFIACILFVIGNKLAYIISIPAAIFLAFWGFERLRKRYNLKLMRY
jgi:hypothetical protein